MNNTDFDGHAIPTRVILRHAKNVLRTLFETFLNKLLKFLLKISYCQQPFLSHIIIKGEHRTRIFDA